MEKLDIFTLDLLGKSFLEWGKSFKNLVEIFRGKYFSLFASKRWGTISEIRGFGEEFFIFESFLSVVFAEI